MEIIDFHMHPFVKEGESVCYYRSLLRHCEADILPDMARAGIDRFCGSLIADKKDPQQFSLDELYYSNKTVLDLRERLGGRYIPGMLIHPAYVRESLEEMERMHKAGVRLIGEIVPIGQQCWNCDIDTPVLDEVYELAGELDMVVSYHSTYVDKETHLAKSHPKTRFVAAHPGDFAAYSRHLDQLAECENLSLDLSGTGIFRYGMLAEGVHRLGAERFVFGTDYPVCNPAMYVAAVDYEKITDRDKELIYAKNAKRLLGL